MTDIDLTSLISNRRSVRAFRDKKVPRELIDKILTISKNCPTGGNMQPWNIAILSGKSKNELSQKLLEEFDKKTQPNPDYNYYPLENFAPFAWRRHKAGEALYHACDITFTPKHVDWDEVVKLIRSNFNFFGADTALIFHIDNRLTSGAHIDIGIFMQNIVLLAEYYGLSTCPQAAIANYPDIIRTYLDLGKERKILCALSIGYADEKHPINQAVIKKEAVDSFAKWYD